MEDRRFLAASSNLLSNTAQRFQQLCKTSSRSGGVDSTPAGLSEQSQACSALLMFCKICVLLTPFISLQTTANPYHSLTQTLSGGGEAVSGFTFTAEASWHVQTGCVLLANWPVLTLIDI